MKLSLIFYLISLFLWAVSLHAEITLDGTLGPRVSLEGPDYTIDAKLGQQYGSNLFHSFEHFNLNAQESATFSGPNSINHVISRVTGGYPSNIDGLLRSTIPDADVYLINPAGMMFGPNAILDIPGSFHASTADTLRLQDGGEFNAINPQKSLLTVAPVSAFGFLTKSPQPLTVEGSQLTTYPGKTLSLVGGNLQINQSFLTAASGRINLASVANSGHVTLLADDLALSAFPGDVALHNSIVTVSGDRGGIFIRAGQFFLEQASVQVNAHKQQHGGQIDVQAKTLIAKGGRFITNNLGSGQGGQIKIKVEGVTEFSGENRLGNASGIIANSQKGNAGAIDLGTGSLNIKAGANINATAYGQGQGGSINIHAKDSITLSGIGSRGQGSSIVANTRGKMANAGNGGVIVLEARKLHLTEGALIGTTTLGSAQGGQVDIKITDNLTLSGEDKRGITSSILTLANSSGDGGTITLEANQLNLFKGASIRADSSSTGQSGHIKIRANDLVKFAGVDSAGYGSFMTANASGRMEKAGNGGTIVLEAKRLQLTDGAQIGTSTFGTGQSGKVDIQLTKEATFSGKDQSEDGFRSGLFTSSEAGATGNAGTIVLKTDFLNLTDSAEINASNQGIGLGGNVNIQAHNITLTSSRITAHSDSQTDAGNLVLTIKNKLQMYDSSVETEAKRADGGNIIFHVPGYVYLENSNITTSVNEEFGNGGNIILDQEFLVLDKSQIFAKAKKGQGGNIDITTTGIYNFSGEPLEDIINASSELGVDGVVTVNSPDVNLDEFLIVLPNILIEASLKDCDIQEIENPSRFKIIQTRKTPPIVK